MLQATAIVDSLKRHLKARGVTYADLAARIGMSEASVKRMFSQKNFTLQRLDDILRATDIDFRDVANSAHVDSKLITQLTFAQEKEIISESKLLLVAVSMLNQLTVEQLVGNYQIKEAEVVKCLVRLDKIGFLELLPNNRVKLLIARTFRWIPNGPIQNYFREQAYSDYLASRFDGPEESLQLVNVMLSKTSIATMIKRLKQLAQECAQQHQEDAKLPFDDRFAISFLLAARPWKPQALKDMVRKK